MWLLALCLVSDSLHTTRVAVAPRESLHVTVTGDAAAPPVVLVPSLFGAAFAFRRVVPALTAAGYRVIVIEPLGVGHSSRPERADYSLTAQADRIARVLDTLGIDPAVFVAHSVGGSIAYRVAYRHPELVRGIVSLDGGPVEAAATPGFRRAMRFAPWIKLFGGMKLIRRKIHRYLVDGSADTLWVTAAVVAGYTAGAAADLDATLKAYLGMAAAREPERLHDHLRDIQCPVRLVVGAVAHPGGPSAQEVLELRAGLGTFALDSVPGAGHFVYEEQPGAVVAAVQRLTTVAIVGSH